METSWQLQCVLVWFFNVYKINTDSLVMYNVFNDGFYF